MKRFKGGTSRKPQQEFPKLKERYWGRHFWATGYGAWSTGNITDKMVNDYLEHHRRKDSDDNTDFILEWKSGLSVLCQKNLHLSVQGGLVLEVNIGNKCVSRIAVEMALDKMLPQ